jgi:hypothetical protein
MTASTADAFVPACWPASAPALARVRACTTTRRAPDGAPGDTFSLGGCAGDITRQRQLLARALALPAAPLWMRQVHGTGVLEIDRAGARALHAGAAEPEADAAVTREAGVVLAVLTADCLPLVLAADDGGEIGIVHAGWRGLAAGVIEACAARLRAPPQALVAWLGPAIGAQAYEVGDDVRAAFTDAHAGDAAAFHATRPGHWLCDLYALARARLHRIGIERSAGGEHCTRTEVQRFHSHRAGSTGRMATLAWIEPTTDGNRDE